MNAILKDYPRVKEVVLLACKVVVSLKPLLPRKMPPILISIQEKALAIFASVDSSWVSVYAPALNFVFTLWKTYPKELPPMCNVDHLTALMKVVLDLRYESAAIAVGAGLGFFMQFLNNQQLAVFERGVSHQLRVLMTLYEDMSAESLEQIVTAIGIFSDITPRTNELIEEGIHTHFLMAAVKHSLNGNLQELIWGILCQHIRKNPTFVRQLVFAGVCPKAATILKNKGKIVPIVVFLHACCKLIPSLIVHSCLNTDELMEFLVESTSPESSVQQNELVNICDFLAFLCTSCKGNSMSKLFDYKIVNRLEDCARKLPVPCIFSACIAMEALINLFPPDKKDLPEVYQEKVRKVFSDANLLKDGFYKDNHHLFIKDMLSYPKICSNSTLVEMLYTLFLKLLKYYPRDALDGLYTRDFVEFFVVAFVRDTSLFPDKTSRIAFTTHYLTFLVKNEEQTKMLQELNLHTAVADLLSNCSSFDVTTVVTSLMACLLSKYHHYLKDLKPVLATSLPDTLVEKVKLFGRRKQSQFSEDITRILLNLTAEKDYSQELYSKGYMDKLLALLQEPSDPIIERYVIHAVGNIALAGQHVKQTLLDRYFYKTLLDILDERWRSEDAYLLCACCRVLHILAAGDWAKRKFVELGSVGTLLKILRNRTDNVELVWRSLGLISSLGFMAAENRRYILSQDVLETTAKILKESNHGKVVSYTGLVFLASGELDDGCVKLTELEIVKPLQQSLKVQVFKTQAPDLERWVMHILEKEFLYTVSVPSSLFSSLQLPSPFNPQFDWPPLPAVDPLPAGDFTDDGATHTELLPLSDECLSPNFPLAPQLEERDREQLASLGLDLSEPPLRIGRVFGSTHGICSNCEKDGLSEELVIRIQSMTPFQYQELIDRGWYRRGGVKLFRLRKNHNVHCCDWETRVLVHGFDHRKHKSYKKVLRRMPIGRLTIETLPTHFNRDAFDLYNSYHLEKHDKPLKSEYSYYDHVVNSPIKNQTVNGFEYGTYHQLYRMDGKLVAVGIIDIVPKGVVSIYMWYSLDKAVAKHSFGVFSALKEIELVCNLSKQNKDLKYYYLQGWNENNKKLMYKANYEPEHFYCPCVVRQWVPTVQSVAQVKEEFIKEQEELAEKHKMDSSSDNTDGGSSVPTTSAGPSEKASENKTEQEKSISCEAFPHDRANFEEVAKAKIDVSKIVVCLNYSRYMHLGEVFSVFKVEEDQRKLMEERYEELLAALGPHISSQLIIDLKVCSQCER